MLHKYAMVAQPYNEAWPETSIARERNISLKCALLIILLDYLSRIAAIRSAAVSKRHDNDINRHNAIGRLISLIIINVA